MDAYWSIEVCGWVRPEGQPDPLATPWSVHTQPQQTVIAEDVHPPLPGQRSPAGTRVEA